MKKLVGGLLLTLMTTSVVANEIYINQIGDTLDLDIVQSGDNNRIGSAAAGDMVLNGDDMTFSITQTGNSNTIDATIKGNNYTGTWVFTGDRNTVDLLCSSTTTGACDTVTLDITTTGSDNDYTFKIGETTAADSSIIDFTVTGDGNVIDMTLDGQSADITVALDDGSSGLTNTAGNTNDLTITSTGDGTTGNVVDLDITGSGGTYNVTQTGTLIDQKVTATFDGDDANVDITQSD
jgi:hypothetical protein